MTVTMATTATATTARYLDTGAELDCCGVFVPVLLLLLLLLVEDEYEEEEEEGVTTVSSLLPREL